MNASKKPKPLDGYMIVVAKYGWILVALNGSSKEETINKEVVRGWVAEGAEPEWKDSETGEW